MTKTYSLLKKYFLMFTAVILLSTFAVSGVLLLISSGVLYDKYEDVLEKSVSDAISQTQTVMAEMQGSGKDTANIKLYEISKKDDVNLFLLDETGNIIIGTGESELKYSQIEEVFNNYISKEKNYENTYLFSDLDSLLDTKYHIKAIEFSYNGKMFNMIGISPHRFELSGLQIAFVIIIIAVMTLIINAVICFIVKRRSLKLISQMTKLADSIGKGEFVDKIPLSGAIEFYQLETSLNNLAESVQKNDEIRNQFVSNVSHELRTPLTSISGFVDGIIDGTITSEQEPQYLKLISQEVKRLTRLTRLMLNLEQLESGAIKPVMMDINVISIIVDILNTFEKKIREKNLEVFGLDVGTVTVFADNDMIYQVIYNLIENAIKFTQESGYIEFGFNDDADYNYISVKNSGEGLSEQERERVFNRFYKTDSSRGKDSIGVGLGLNIVRSIISIHNGTIDVDSALDDYTQFTFSIPKYKD